MSATKNYQNYTFKNEASRARMERVIELLHEPRTCDELAEKLSISKNAMHAYLKALKDGKVIHIHDWRRNFPGSPTRIYLVGNKPDKRRPMVMSQAQIQRKRRANNPELAVADAANKRLKRMKPKRDDMTAALFGKA